MSANQRATWWPDREECFQQFDQYAPPLISTAKRTSRLSAQGNFGPGGESLSGKGRQGPDSRPDEKNQLGMASNLVRTNIF